MIDVQMGVDHGNDRLGREARSGEIGQEPALPVVPYPTGRCCLSLPRQVSTMMRFADVSTMKL